ncbi:MAG: hypothetical protein KGL42_17720, partial [Betaproteobacteria bacterium]|nr:hypothetical protein [Betaproteobacteria bacterium]
TSPAAGADDVMAAQRAAWADGRAHHAVTGARRHRPRPPHSCRFGPAVLVLRRPPGTWVGGRDALVLRRTNGI